MESIGPFTLESELGRGAMGVVFRGFDPAIGRPVAIKIIQGGRFATLEETADLKQRFAREAAAAGRLSHPNIVTIYQFGEEGDLQYLVQELIDGGSLSQLIQRERPDVKRTLSILSQVGDALDYAHSHGVVHRDVKPANILIGADGRAKLTDFGIARVASQTITGSGLIIGTPAYMAPEVINGTRGDERADQFALAVMTYELLSGRHPFAAETQAGLMFKIVSEHPAALHTLNPSLPHVMSEVLFRALAKSRERRYATCSAFVAALENALVAPVQAAAPIRPASLREPIPIRPPVLLADHSESSARRWPWAVAGIVILAAAIGSKALLNSKPDGSGARKTPLTGQSEVAKPAASPAKRKTAAKQAASPVTTKGDTGQGDTQPPETPVEEKAPSRTAERAPDTAPKTTGRGTAGPADVLFDRGSANIRKFTELSRAAQGLKQFLSVFPDDWVYVEGNADETEGTATECALLGTQRAEAVREALIKLQVPMGKLRPISNGRNQPLCKETSEECLQKNRRVHFRFAP
jgi:serine/threonine-protein kinase